MFDFGLKSSQMIGPALMVGVLAFAAVISQAPESSDTIQVTAEVPDSLAFDDSQSLTSTGQAVPPDAIASGLQRSDAPSAQTTGAPAPITDSASGEPGTSSTNNPLTFRPSTPPQFGSGARSTTSPTTTSGPRQSSTTGLGASTPATTTSRPATTTNPATTRPTTARPTTAAPTTAAPTTAAPARPTTAAPTTSPPSTATPTTAPPATSNGRVIGVLLEGESTSDSNDGWNQYPNSVGNQLGAGVTVHVDGTNGYRIDDVNNEGGKSQLLTGGSGSNVAVLWIGINDTSQGREPSDTYAQMTTWIQNRRAEGWDHVVLLTVTKFEHDESVKGYSWGSHTIAEQKRQELNQLIVANSAGADRIVDLRTITGIGDPYSVYDTTYRPDKVHFTNTGNELVADRVVSAIRSLQP